MLVGLGFPYEMKSSAFACPVRGEVVAGLSETEAVVGPATYVIGVVVVLAVVLPEAHGADVVHAALARLRYPQQGHPYGSSLGGRHTLKNTLAFSRSRRSHARAATPYAAGRRFARRLSVIANDEGKEEYPLLSTLNV
jgi:hypothetical protein